VVNHFYVYAVDADFGPFFLKFCSYFPYNAKLCLNGHEWAKRQATKAGIGFTALDNGFAALDDPADLPRPQGICQRLGAEQIQAPLGRWLAILPHPFTAVDRAAGYRYDIAVWQAEFSVTQVLDRPVFGRVFFEQLIRDNLDAAPPRPGRADLRPTAHAHRASNHPGPVPHPSASMPSSRSSAAVSERFCPRAVSRTWGRASAAAGRFRYPRCARSR